MRSSDRLPERSPRDMRPGASFALRPASMADVDAIHPGYGFLSERAEFAQICRDCKIEFIGPSPEAMGKLGDKVECKRTAKANKVPIFPGSEGAIEDEDEAAKIAAEIGYESEATFSRAFKKMIGVPPSAWRRRE